MRTNECDPVLLTNEPTWALLAKVKSWSALKRQGGENNMAVGMFDRVIAEREYLVLRPATDTAQPAAAGEACAISERV